MLPDAVLTLHIAGGSTAVLAGYAALAVRKGARPHRVAGNVFFAAMLVLGATAAALDLLKGEVLGRNVFGGLFVCYLVATAWGAVRRPAGRVGRLELAGCLWAGAMTLAAVASASPLAILTGLAAALDFRMVRSGGLAGFERVRRHLWRMCAALFVATGSFCLGQMDEIPRALHGPHLWVLGLAPLGALAFWMVRTRPRRRFDPVPAAT